MRKQLRALMDAEEVKRQAQLAIVQAALGKEDDVPPPLPPAADAESERRRESQRRQEEAVARERDALAKLEAEQPLLARATAAAEPWPAELAEMFGSLRPAKVLDVLHGLRVRTHLYAHDPSLAGPDGRVPELTRLVRRAPGGGGPPAARLTQALRRQFAVLTSALPDDVRRKLDHVYQVQAQPRALEAKMNRFYGLTFIRSGVGEDPLLEPGSPPFVPVESVLALTLTCRRHQRPGRPGHRVDVLNMFDVKLHTLEVDPDAGRLAAGGCGRGADGPAAGRCVDARHFNYTPYGSGDSRVLPAHYTVVTDGALAAHRAVEMTVLHGGAAQRHPDLPRAYLAFPRDDDVDFEASPALEWAAYRQVDGWFRRGKPDAWLGMEQYPSLFTALRRRLSHPGRSWADVARQLGAADALLLLQQTWNFHEESCDGLTLVPLEFFLPYSPQRPARRAVRAYLRFEPYLTGREGLEVVEHALTDEAGNTIRRMEAVTRGDASRAKAQVVRVGRGSPPAGEIPAGDYDWTGLPPGMAQHFQEAP